MLAVGGRRIEDMPDDIPSQDNEIPDDTDQETELTTDVVIVGAGGTGLATSSAFENGADLADVYPEPMRHKA